MTERHRGEGAEPPEGFDWLYGTSNKGVGSDDATQVLPGKPAPKTYSSSREPEPTRVIPRVPGSTKPPAGAQPRKAGPGGPSQPPPPSRPVKSPGSKGRGRRIRPGRIVLLLVMLWVAYMVAVPLFAWNTISKVDAEPSGDRPGNQPGTTYLLVGSDSRKGLTAKQRQRLNTGGDVGQRTDTIMLLHTGDGPNLLLSIPRDSIVDIPGRGSGKINAAYAYGQAPLLVQTIEQNTGIRIDNYVEIGFGGFVKMVNAVGGIEICPKKDMVDRDAGLRVKAGCQEAGGKKALAYARSRHAQQLGDIDRAANQREVVAAIGSKAMSPGSFLNPFRYYRLAFAGAESVNVGDNVSPLAFANFAMAMRKVTGEDGLTCGVPIRDFAVHWDEERSKQMFNLIIEDRTSEIGKGLCSPSGARS